MTKVYIVCYSGSGMPYRNLSGVAYAFLSYKEAMDYLVLVQGGPADGAVVEFKS